MYVCNDDACKANITEPIIPIEKAPAPEPELLVSTVTPPEECNLQK